MSELSQANDSSPLARSVRLENPARSINVAPDHKYRPPIDGLRCIAIVLVVLFHAGVPFVPGGFVGVDVFFVISGFLIIGSLASEMERHGRIQLAKFYARRARRLLPLSALVLSFVAIASLWLMPLVARSKGDEEIIAASLFGSNWLFAQQSTDYWSNTAPSPVLNFWSLSVEEQFYFLIPLIAIGTFLLARKSSGTVQLRLLAIAMAVVTTASLLISIQGGADSASYFALTSRAWELGVGGLLALAMRVARFTPRPLFAALGWVGLACIILATVSYSKDTPFPGSAALLPVLGTAMVLAAVTVVPAAGVSKLLNWRVAVSIGAVSYALYLWHWPLLIFAGSLTNPPGTAEPSVPLWATAVAVAMSFALAYATTIWIERPIRFAPGLVNNVRGSLKMGVALIVLPIAVILTLAWTPIGSTNDGLTQTALAAAAEASERSSECFVSDQDSVDPGTAEECQAGDPNGKKTVVLVGDSHAGAWAPAYAEAATKNHWKVHYWGMSRCVFAATEMLSGTGAFSNSTRDPAKENCPKFVNKVFDQIGALPRVDLLVVAQFSDFFMPFVDSDSKYSSALKSFVNGLAPNVKRVAFTRDGIKAPFNVPACVAQGNSDSNCDFAKPAMPLDDRAVSAFRAIAASDDRVAIIDINQLVCPGKICESVPGGNVLFSDANHPTVAFARDSADRLAQQIKPLLTG